MGDETGDTQLSQFLIPMRIQYFIDVILLMTCHANGCLISDLLFSHVTMETMETMVTRGDIGMWKARAKIYLVLRPDESKSQCLALRNRQCVHFRK